MFPIYYFSFRAKATMWLCNILELCREREFCSLTFPWISMNFSGNYNYEGNIIVRSQNPLLSQQGKKEQKVWSTTAQNVLLFTSIRVIL